MEIVLQEHGSDRISPMDITLAVVQILSDRDKSIAVLEIDDDNDNLFCTTRDDGELYHNEYLQIRLDKDFYKDAPVYFIEIFERQHSGGDISQRELFEFFPNEIEHNLLCICDAYTDYFG
ncbi:hypothetical protein [Photobacterium lutimaris]|uniref:Uncharacterized protein n=1 Tax=Photobacterium lutimaris TaxID=388278 RepID=A0A2T3ITM6_9GAMM|nr:hypothetical protein [Photobacterium lutimaris]PSU31714.1 hypothetical protein C9I99_21240 [Photobacterium lutimaris]TDR72647.1 hypothetical protein DFP78_113123 [Photobacterium lutimaris]